MSQEDIFGDGKPAGTPPSETPPADNPLLTKLMEIKNENGEPKYDSMEKAIDALKASQEYIPSLKEELDAKERELAELKAKQESSESVESIVEKLLQKQKAEESPPHQEENKGLDEDSVAAIVRREQEALEKDRKKALNAQKVTETLTEMFGEKTKEKVAEKAKELGLEASKLGELAQESPDAVLKLFQSESRQTPTPTTSDVNTSIFQRAPENFEVDKPSKSLLSGASAKDQAAYMKEIKEAVYRKYGVET